MTARHPIPDAALDDRLGFLGMTGSGKVKTRVTKGPLAAPRPCSTCGDLFAPHRKNPGAKFCCRRCEWASNKGPEFNARIARESAVLRGDVQRGRGDGKTYRKFNGRHEHRVTAEQKLGRPLRPGEVVHHEDEHKQNNDPRNLDVLPSQAEHAKLHFSGKKQSAEHVRKRVEATRRTKQADRGAGQ